MLKIFLKDFMEVFYGGSIMKNREIDKLSANTIRCMALDIVEKAKSGHPGFPLGCADYAYILWRKFLKFNPDDPGWINRDRFILSAGHGSALLYTLLHLSGFNITIEDLKSFRQFGSKTPGHPEHDVSLGIEATTGPLGQGFAMGVGMALAEKMMQERLGKDIINHKVYMIASDGDLMEGISYEASSLAGTLGLDNLIVIYDDNHITIDGRTEITFTEDVEMRFKACGWEVKKIDGHNFDEIEEGLKWAQNENGKPKLIIAKTIIGQGLINKKNTPKIHGSPAGEEEIKLAKEKMGFDPHKSFYIPEEVYNNFKERIKELKEEYNKWQEEFKSKVLSNKEKKEIYDKLFNFKIPSEIESSLYQLFENISEISTREASGKILQELAKIDERLIAGSADLFSSVKCYLKEYPPISKGNFKGRNIYYGIREHAMAGITNGIKLYGGFKPYCSTFFVFSDYMRPSIRLSALMKIGVIYIFSHDSIFVGEDGPTHQPVEHLSSLRAIPELVVIRPADAYETIGAYLYAIEEENKPVAIILTRQKVKVIDRNKYEKPEVEKGGYIIKKENGKCDLIIIATGSEVSPSIEAAEKLEKEGYGVRVVSMPSIELFEQQSQEYKNKILPPEVKNRIIVEAGVTLCWHKYAGEKGKIIGIDRFGASAPYKVLAEKFNLNSDTIYKAAKELLE